MEQLLTIEIFGQPYTFQTDLDLTKAKAVADTLVHEVRQIESQQKKSGKDLSKNTMLVLAALNIAMQNAELKEKHEDLIKTILMRAERIILSLDEEGVTDETSR